MASDDVSLPDLEVIAQFSLAVRAATAPRAQVVAALQADLAFLTGETAPRRAVPRPGSITRSAPAEGEAPKRRAPAKKSVRTRAAAPEA